MSLILDALRKMELERKAKRQGSPEIRAEVLNYRAKPQRPEKSRLLPVIAALLLISTATAVFLYFKSSDSPRTESVKTTVAVDVASPPQTTDPQTLPPVKAVPPAVVDSAAEVPRPTALKDEVSQPSTDKTIEISGIAWQEERSLRRAVINGTLVGEGAEVFGAKVVEIRENLVRFNRRGRTFEVMYSSGAGR